ncbi:MAG: Esterase EstD [Herbaspirillum frisingense]|uniref:Esterase EstD n=1 Tax=Herbaspirillum frisingense TaxID=92645 RepID=A0A7V8FZU3_9BURK|nr:MAG: Esterase EstD [Herbaspirillum frisingense]
MHGATPSSPISHSTNARADSIKRIASLTAALAISTGAAAEMTQTEITAPGPLGPLRGTLLSPATTPQAPVVLIVPGSGPTDRDGNNRYGIRGATYRLLAQGLAERGIASVRIDKRGLFGSAAAATSADDVTIADYAGDVHAWIASIRRQTNASCVWVLGHSEGGLIGLAAARTPGDICGLILVAAAGRPLGQLLEEQLRANLANAPLLDKALAALRELEAGHVIPADRIDAPLMPLFHPKVQRFLMSEMALDPAALIAGYDKPVLIVQGLKDLQVRRQDAERLKAANPDAEMVLIPDANHVLKKVDSDDPRENFATYGATDLPLEGRIVPAITEFILRPRGQ